MNVWETGPVKSTFKDLQLKVKEFVQINKDTMGYDVAMDTEDGFMSDQWLDAAGVSGIPTTIIVKNKMIAWIGHPMEMGNVLQIITAMPPKI